MYRMVKAISLSVLLAVPSSQLWACPLCKFALETSPDEPRAYMISILFMMGTIMTLFSSMAFLLWWVSKQEKMNLTAAGYQHLFENAVEHSSSPNGNPYPDPKSITDHA